MHVLETALTSHKNVCKIVKQKIAQKNTLHTILLYHSMTLSTRAARVDRRFIINQEAQATEADERTRGGK